MLLQRILTAVPLAVGVIWLILYQPSDRFVYLLYLIAFIAGFEWALLAGMVKTMYRLAFATVLAGLSWLMLEYFTEYVFLFVYVSVLLWVGIYAFLLNIQPVKTGPVFSPVKTLAAILIVPSAVYSMYLIHQIDNGATWLLYGLALVWVADIGAYFSGKKYGRTKLAEKISPGKTREGLWGAVAATSLYTLLFALYSGLEGVQIILILLLSIVLTLISVTGDLYESYLKRECGIKDSGNILPGHGGILDRIDSVLAAMPVFIVGCHWLLFPVEGLYP